MPQIALFQLFTSAASAQSADADVCATPSAAVLEWRADGSTNDLLVQLAPGATVTVTFKALLAHLEHAWEQGPYTADAYGDVFVPVTVPRPLTCTTRPPTT
jgi:hypothetical protein